MANPRRKNSKARTRKRRSVYYASVRQPAVQRDPDCGCYRVRHRVCPTCGLYRGRQIVEAQADV